MSLRKIVFLTFACTLVLSGCSEMMDHEIDPSDIAVTITNTNYSGSTLWVDYNVTNNSNRTAHYYCFDIVVNTSGGTFRDYGAGNSLEPGETDSSFTAVTVGSVTIGSCYYEDVYAIDYADGTYY